MSRIPHCLDSRLADGGKVVSPTLRQHSTPQEYYFSVSGTHFCYMLSKPQGLLWPEGLDQFKKIFTLSGLETATFLLIA
jgi:hypothetical protein